MRAQLWASVFVSGFLLTVGALAAAATERKVSGIITAVEDRSMTLALPQGQKVVTGRLDGRRTKILVDGRPARASDLKITFGTKAELGLDDVWITVRADSR